MAFTRKQALRIGVYVTLGGFVLIALLHPFSRQTLFGPKIRDLPLCYWQDGFRRRAIDDGSRDSLATKVFRWLGFDTREQFVDLPDGADGLRVLLTPLWTIRSRASAKEWPAPSAADSTTAG